MKKLMTMMMVAIFALAGCQSTTAPEGNGHAGDWCYERPERVCEVCQPPQPRVCEACQPQMPDPVPCLRQAYALAGDWWAYIRATDDPALDADAAEAEAEDRADIVNNCVGDYMDDWRDWVGR